MPCALFDPTPFLTLPGVFSGVDAPTCGLSGDPGCDYGTLIGYWYPGVTPRFTCRKRELGALSLHTHTYTYTQYIYAFVYTHTGMYVFKTFLVAISAVHQIFPGPCLLSICFPGPFVSRQGRRTDTDRWMWWDVCPFYTAPIIAAVKPLELFCPWPVTNKVQDGHHSITWTFEWP